MIRIHYDIQLMLINDGEVTVIESFEWFKSRLIRPEKAIKINRSINRQYGQTNYITDSEDESCSSFTISSQDEEKMDPDIIEIEHNELKYGK